MKLYVISDVTTSDFDFRIETTKDDAKRTFENWVLWHQVGEVRIEEYDTADDSKILLARLTRDGKLESKDKSMDDLVAEMKDAIDHVDDEKDEDKVYDPIDPHNERVMEIEQAKNAEEDVSQN